MAQDVVFDAEGVAVLVEKLLAVRGGGVWYFHVVVSGK